ncbi:site-specific integrase [Rhodopirellula sp. MGV]|uniref:site-specific integrase n=1 Tax=Rhodopirellula sp. MGV TaxID=2023130 RepID=UPI0011798AC4|nr:site-specific integrase [Rhodopirellula sp. MGV]
MAREAKLNWEASRGKWRVRYRGQSFRFDGGSGKSDRVAHKAAQAAWKRRKTELDSEFLRAREHQRDYEACLAEWQAVLGYASEVEDKALLARASRVIKGLQKDLAAEFLEPLASGRRFLAAQPLSELEDHEIDALLVYEPRSQGGGVEAQREHAKRLDAIWRSRIDDRLGHAEVKAEPDSIAETIAAFLDHKRAEANSGNISAGRADSLRGHLSYLEGWEGVGQSVKQIDARWLDGFRESVLEKISNEEISTSYAKDILGAVKQWVRWLYHTERIDQVPRNLDSRHMSIAVKPVKIKVVSIEDWKVLKANASERTELYMLLGLNCGMTQIDMSDLRPADVDWEAGTITRKRNKTRKFKSVPTVTYQLWPRTFELLKQFRSESPERVLLTKEGRILVESGIKDDNKLQKRDSVRLAIRYLRGQTGIEVTMKMLKKLSASLIRDSKEFNGLESLFLDQAESRVSGKHYALPPQQLLYQAIDWLEVELGIRSS